jgi:hypothetical protein
MTNWKRRFRRKKEASSQAASKHALHASEAMAGNDATRSFPVTPRNCPEPINHHLVSQDGGKTWQNKPGVLAAVISGRKVEDTDLQIKSVFSSLGRKTPDNQELKTKIVDCRHKLYAVKYHLTTIQSEIKARVEEFRTNYRANSGTALELENQRLIFETEAFLFQVKSSLDLLTQALGHAIPPLRSFHSFAHKGSGNEKRAGGKVIDTLARTGFNELSELFEEHRKKWIQNLVAMRDEVTHYSRLKGFRCFVEEPYTGHSEVQIHYPTMPCGLRVDRYCQDVYEGLLQLYRSAAGLIDSSAQE